MGESDGVRGPFFFEGGDSNGVCGPFLTGEPGGVWGPLREAALIWEGGVAETDASGFHFDLKGLSSRAESPSGCPISGNGVVRT